jgi:hypothetical protein
MYQTLSTSEAIDILRADTYARWSRSGARALVEYLEQVEEEGGERIEIDPVAIRCDYSEYTSAVEAASDLSDWEYRPDESGADYDEDEAEEHARQYLQDRTTVIVFDGGVIVQAF